MITRPCKNSGQFLCIILKVFNSTVLILRALSEGNLECLGSVSYELIYINYNYFWFVNIVNLLAAAVNHLEH